MYRQRQHPPLCHLMQNSSATKKDKLLGKRNPERRKIASSVLAGCAPWESLGKSAISSRVQRHTRAIELSACRRQARSLLLRDMLRPDNSTVVSPNEQLVVYSIVQLAACNFCFPCCFVTARHSYNSSQPICSEHPLVVQSIANHSEHGRMAGLGKTRTRDNMTEEVIAFQ